MAEPTRLLQYQIIETLGQGGNGTVYRVQDPARREDVALKTLKNVSEVTLSRFKREFLSLQKMDYPGIVKVYDGYFDHNPPFFTMEWVRGKTLSDMLADMENNPMIFEVADRENFAIRLGIQVCDILDHIHSFEEVHRDLKPDNMFITLEGSNLLSEFHVKMLDFGLLKQVGNAEEKQDTEGGMIVGTVHYLSPEQAKGSTLDPRSDLFSLGIIMYKIISLKLPYEAKDVVGYIFKTVFEEPAPIDQHTPECSGLMQALLRDLLSRDVVKRPPTAKALKRRLKGMLNKEAVMPALDIEASDLDFTAGIEGFGSPLLPPPLTGREDAVKKLEACVEGMHREQPYGVVIIGEPGMGRSSMLKEWRARIKFTKPVFLQAHFPEEIIPTQDPLGMLIDSLIRGMKPEEVRQVFRDVYPFLSSVSRYLSRYFDTKSVGRFDHLSPSRKLQVLAINFIKLLNKLGSKGPVIMILDDVHNAPERFFGWLTLFWEQVKSTRLLMVFSCSHDPSKAAFTQFKNRLVEDVDSLTLELKPLDVNQTVDLLQSMLPIGTEIPFSQKLKKLIMERANGNPYYAIELFSTLYEDEQVFINRGQLDVRDTGSLDVPLSIHQALLKKVKRLPEESYLLLKAASVLGHSFDYHWLVSSLRWPDVQFLEHLQSLMRMGIISEEEAPVHRLYFNAPALQKIIYDQIPKKERQFLHQNIARAIEQELKNDDVISLEQLAHHYSNGANPVRAIKYAYLAGNCALLNKDTDKAIFFYELSLSMMDRMENKQARNLVNLKLAEVHLENEKPHKALQYYNESLAQATLSKMERLRSLRGRMLCHKKLHQLQAAYEDAASLAVLGKTCSKRIQAETLYARGQLGWLAGGKATAFRKDIMKANLLYPKLPNWPVNTAFAQFVANDVLEAHKRLKDLVKKKYEPRLPVHLQLAAIRYFMGDFKKARASLSKAREGDAEIQSNLDPALMVVHSLLTFKVQGTLAPDHPSDEYLAIAERYIERFGLQHMKVKIHLIKLEHYLINGLYDKAWELTSFLVKSSADLPLEHLDLHLFLSLTMRAAWEVQERPPRGWLLKFQRFTPEEDAPFILRTHWALAKAAEAALPLSMGGPDALKAIKQVQQQLVTMKLKYYYRALLVKEIGLLSAMGRVDQSAKLAKLRAQIDATIDVALPG